MLELIIVCKSLDLTGKNHIVQTIIPDEQLTVDMVMKDLALRDPSSFFAVKRGEGGVMVSLSNISLVEIRPIDTNPNLGELNAYESRDNKSNRNSD